MRLPKVENYKNDQLIERRKIQEVPPIERNIILMSEKDKIKLIKTIERIVRSSQEYKQYIAFLRKEVDMTMCSFFNNISNKESKKVSIEIHHEPFTLFDITQIVLEKWIAENKKVNPILIAEEVMKLHYQNKVGLIPLSITVHELVHSGKLFIPLQNVYGDFISFFEEYEPYISNDLKDILQIKLKMSKELENLDMSILEKKYVYLEIDGMTFPQPLEEIIEK
jgi:hypothetical protein